MSLRLLPHIALAVVTLSTSRGEPIAPNRSEADFEVKNLGELRCYRIVTLRGVLSFEHIRKLQPPPQTSYSTYVLRTAGIYTVTYRIDATQTSVQMSVNAFNVEAPRHLSLISYREHRVEISGRLLPQGKFPDPTIIVDTIHRLHDQNI